MNFRNIIKNIIAEQIDKKLNLDNLDYYLKYLENGNILPPIEIMKIRELLRYRHEKRHEYLNKNFTNYKDWKIKSNELFKEFMKYNNLLSKQTNSYGIEGDVSANECYHYTDVSSCIDILEDNKFESYGEIAGLSVTTQKGLGNPNSSQVKWYGENNKPLTFADLGVRFDINLNKIKKEGIKIRVGSEDLGTFAGEFELKLGDWNGINNANKYINRIVLNNSILSEEEINKVKELSMKKNIPVIVKETIEEINKNKLHIRKLIKEILNEEFPVDFDLEFFKSLTSFRKRVAYCQEKLKRISSGSSRIVYEVDNNKVLKLAYNKKGVKQNEVEHSYSQEPYISYLFTKVYEVDDNYLWIESEKALKLTKRKFNDILGYSFEEFTDVIRKNDPSLRNPLSINISKEKEEEIIESEFYQDVFDYFANFPVPIGDLLKINSYGIVNRNGEEEIVIIDYGFTNEVRDNYYLK